MSVWSSTATGREHPRRSQSIRVGWQIVEEHRTPPGIQPIICADRAGQVPGVHQPVLRQAGHQVPGIQLRRRILPNCRHLHDPLKQTFPAQRLVPSVESQLPAALRVVTWAIRL
jgi:hypothetical protein